MMRFAMLLLAALLIAYALDVPAKRLRSRPRAYLNMLY